MNIWKTLGFLILLSVGLTTWYIWRSSNHRLNGPTAGTNIIAFGDSLTAGVGATPGNDYVSALSRKFNLNVVNAGVSGDTTAEALRRLDRDVLSQDPNIVMILLGGNDALRNVSHEVTFQNLGTIIDRIQAQGAAVLLLGIRGGLVDTYRQSFDDLAKRKQVDYLPDIMNGILGNSQLLSDQVHPNDQGYALIAERITPKLQKLIER